MTASRSRRAGWWFAAAALALAVMRPGIALGDGTASEPPEGSRVIKIGPQAVVLVDEHGNVRMYDDPAEEAPACNSNRKCWGQALGILALFGLATYEDWTTSVEAGSGTLQRVGPPD